jgi:hypothetical protein
LPGHEVRELVWNIQYHPTAFPRAASLCCCATCNTSARNHPNATSRSDSLETLFKAITHTRSMDDRRVTDAFGPCLPAFVAYVVHHIVSGGRDSPATSVSHSDVFQHLTVRGALVREASLCHVTHCFSGSACRCHAGVRGRRVEQASRHELVRRTRQHNLLYFE